MKTWRDDTLRVMDYELIDHTADIGIRVRAKDLRGVFENAARAMFDIIAGKRRDRKKAQQVL